MIGVDVVSVERIIKINKDQKLEKRIASIAEQSYLNKKSKNIIDGRKYSEYDYSLAGLFASKEAVLKACGMGLGKVEVNKIEILHKQSGQPYVSLDDKTKESLKIDKNSVVEISIAHDGDIAIAVANIQ